MRDVLGSLLIVLLLTSCLLAEGGEGLFPLGRVEVRDMARVCCVGTGHTNEEKGCNDEEQRLRT
jgi:hypothetical protein